MRIAGWARARPGPALAAAVLAALVACRDGGREERGDRAASAEASAGLEGRALAAADANACFPAGAHGRHDAEGYGCAVCHASGGALCFGTVRFPGGATTEGGIAGTPATHAGVPALSHPATLTNVPQDWCGEIVPNVYYWRVRARDQQGHVSEWSPAGTFGAFAGDPLC
jgi:hypothetical protein